MYRFTAALILTHRRLIPSFSREAPDGTILSGDLDDSGDHTEPDARHVVISANEAGNARLDGFTIQGGYIGWPDDQATSIIVNSYPIGPCLGAGIHNHTLVSFTEPSRPFSQSGAFEFT